MRALDPRHLGLPLGEGLTEVVRAHTLLIHLDRGSLHAQGNPDSLSLWFKEGCQRRATLRGWRSGLSVTHGGERVLLCEKVVPCLAEQPNNSAIGEQLKLARRSCGIHCRRWHPTDSLVPSVGVSIIHQDLVILASGSKQLLGELASELDEGWVTVRKPVLQRGSKVVSLGSVLEDREGDQVTRGGGSSVDSEIGVGRVSADGRFLEGEEGGVRETCESDERKLVSASAGHKWMGCAEVGRENLGAGRVGADGYHSATTTSYYTVLQYDMQRIKLTRPPRACTTFTGVESRFSRSIACV